MPITTPRTVKSSQKIFFSIKPKTLPLIDTDNTDLKLKPKTLKHGGKEEAEELGGFQLPMLHGEI